MCGVHSEYSSLLVSLESSARYCSVCKIATNLVRLEFKLAQMSRVLSFSCWHLQAESYASFSVVVRFGENRHNQQNCFVFSVGMIWYFVLVCLAKM